MSGERRDQLQARGATTGQGHGLTQTPADKQSAERGSGGHDEHGNSIDDEFESTALRAEKIERALVARFERHERTGRDRVACTERRKCEHLVGADGVREFGRELGLAGGEIGGGLATHIVFVLGAVFLVGGFGVRVMGRRGERGEFGFELGENCPAQRGFVHDEGSMSGRGREGGKPALLLARTDGVRFVADMLSKPIPGSSGEVLTELPSPYVPHATTGLLHLPRFLAKCRYVKAHGALPASYAKNYKRGMDKFLCLHLGVEPAAVEAIVHECMAAGLDDAERDRRLLALFPADLRVAKWNRDYVQKGMTPAGREFLKTALTNMGCADRTEQIISVTDLMDFYEGRLE
jgi:hypothetical protein